MFRSSIMLSRISEQLRHNPNLSKTHSEGNRWGFYNEGKCVSTCCFGLRIVPRASFAVKIGGVDAEDHEESESSTCCQYLKKDPNQQHFNIKWLQTCSTCTPPSGKKTIGTFSIQGERDG